MRRVGSPASMCYRRFCSGLSISPPLRDVRLGSRAQPNGMRVTVFGATGMLGPHLVSRLGDVGCEIVVPFRGNGREAANLKLCADLGRVLPVWWSIRDEGSIKRALSTSDVVVNLVGRQWGTHNFSYDDVHVQGASSLAQVAKEAGVKRFIHVSALGADASSPSEFLRTKSHGEAAVLAHYPDATIIRPAYMFGQADAFINHITQSLHLFGFYPYSGEGSTKIQPIFYNDVAKAIVYSINDPKSLGQVYELAGMDQFDWNQLNQMLIEGGDFACTVCQWRNFLPEVFKRLFATSIGKLPVEPKWTTQDFYTRTSLDMLPSGKYFGLSELGVENPERLEHFLPNILRMYIETEMEIHDQDSRVKGLYK